MGRPAAREGDDVAAIDTHIVMVSSPTGPVATPMKHRFRGPLVESLSSSVFVDDHPAAVVGSKARNASPHVPAGGPFQRTPSNEATVRDGSASVFMDDQPCARDGDTALTCNDPSDAPNGRIIAAGTVIAD
jgi:uncharacterized Zn-binding protein involved in type VI secretion